MRRVCAYAQYRSISCKCIGSAYADAKYMRMLSLCRCQAYGYVKDMCTSLFFRSDPKKTSFGSSFNSTTRNNPMTQDVAAPSDANDTRYCVIHLPCDPVLRGRKDRFVYSLTVVHFRKVVNKQKIGSQKNKHPVIY